MYIKGILKYDFNYAEYIITDGKHDLCCMCISVPLPLNRKPEIGMDVLNIIAFCFDKLKIKKIDNVKDSLLILKKVNHGLSTH